MFINFLIAFVLILIDESMILFSEIDCLSLKCKNIGGSTNVRFVFIASFIDSNRPWTWLVGPHFRIGNKKLSGFVRWRGIICCSKFVGVGEKHVCDVVSGMIVNGKSCVDCI